LVLITTLTLVATQGSRLFNFENLLALSNIASTKLWNIQDKISLNPVSPCNREDPMEDESDLIDDICEPCARPAWQRLAKVEAMPPICVKPIIDFAGCWAGQ
jgi:hypothetical protein